MNTPAPMLPLIDTSSAQDISFDSTLAVTNIASVMELASFSSENSGPVAALSLEPDINTLDVAYAHDGMLRKWAIQDKELLQTFRLTPFGLGGASFNQNTELLATSVGDEWEMLHSDDIYKDYMLWNTNTGEPLYDAAEDPHFYYPEIQINPNGHWLLTTGVDDELYFLHNKVIGFQGINREGIGSLTLGVEPQPEEFDYDILAFDTPGGFFAAANESGKVAIYKFDDANPSGQTVGLNEAYVVIEPGDISRLGPRPLALAFAQSRHWLAGVRGTELVLWDLQTSNFPRQWVAEVGEISGITAALSFSPNDELLGVGTANGWQIWNVATGELLASGSKDVGVYAVMFSADGRYFIWGDANGVVHVWGLP